ncbi:hypothetical protein [Ureaplasma urealyticum]|uniref:Uncharacterized protein n=4 Tax=Ureaplasma urealyticum TaxID=2130 RepID=A0AAP9ABX0_UREUR|nr:hypothetical protein [Ureaplasma urealyticum]EDX53575.1 conserved hypothetical protein [Ureaplasma urealyticum serovar 9 str. ATCC 33175]ACI60099.1 conserved hypothetical protein [Ureaplasma urealyticum serovar 10 str. ATCC 33699]EDT49326.1 conserved hypothetical protein [Ureaplasma urealyticum serovar 13 str. ATCC 33698]EDU56937.1 conserved hypothetical protein [Ureaplasma urealyticum serovar 7 str. ATCC 27819]EDU66926.1 conserved hypothetical protein [Ureaplasma urealyticum serovar 11 str
MNFDINLINENDYVFSGYIVLKKNNEEVIELLTYLGDDPVSDEAKIITLYNNDHIDLKNLNDGDLIIVKASLITNDNSKQLMLKDINKLELSIN